MYAVENRIDDQTGLHFPRLHSAVRLTACSVFALAVTGCASQSEQASGPSANPAVEAAIVPEVRDYSVALTLADASESSGDKVSAVRFLSEAIRDGKGGARAWIRRGELLLALNASDAASANFRDALAQGHDESAIFRGYGNALVRLGQPKAALKQYDAALSRDDSDYRIFNGRGVALDMLDQNSEAQDQYRKALDLAPGNLSAQNNLALSYALSGQFDAAIAMLEGIDASGVSDPQHRQNLALLYGLTGRTREAANLGIKDLNQDDVKKNLALYATLRERYDAYKLAQKSSPGASHDVTVAGRNVRVPKTTPTPPAVSPNPVPEVTSPNVNVAEVLDVEDRSSALLEDASEPETSLPEVAVVATAEPAAAPVLPAPSVLPEASEITAVEPVSENSNDGNDTAMADRDNVETAAPVAATLDASWTISLGDYESQQRASQMWLRINARLPGQFQGMTHQVIDQQEGATLTAGPVLAADHAAALCDAVLEIGYSCDVLQPVSADSPFLAELDEPGVDVPDVVEPNTDVTEELTADNSNDVTVQPMPTEEIKTGMIEDGDSLDIDQVETPSSEVSEVDVTDQEAGQPAEDETTISSEPKVNPSDDDQQDRVILTMPVGVSSQDTVPTVLSSPLGVSDQPPVESVDVGPRREVRLPQGVPSVEKSSTDETVSSVVPGVAAMRRSAPNKDIDWGLDLGTYASEAEADLAWLRLRAREQTLLAGFNRRTEDGGSGTKLIAGAVPSRAQADEICKAIVPNRSGCVPYKF